MDDYLKCNICKEKDHEGQYCRCEMRNIRISKEMRSRGDFKWYKLQPERSKREDLKNYDDYELDCGCNAGPGFFGRYVDCNLDHENLIP